MSIDSMIQSSPASVTIVRGTYTHSAMGGPSLSSTAGTTATCLIQIGGGSTGARYGAERAQYDGVAFFLPPIDVRNTDRLTYVDGASATRTFRIESVITPDERASSSHLAYQRVSLQEDLPRT